MPDWEERHALLQKHVVIDGKWVAEKLVLSDQDEQMLDPVVEQTAKSC
jgi:hypothetical protein